MAGGPSARASLADEQARGVTIELPSRPDSAQVARRALEKLEPSVDHNVLARARLLVTELVTNSVKFADATAIRVEVVALQGYLRGEVLDGGQGFAPPLFEDTQLLRTRGWGLILVRRLADRWGVLDGRRGVWFEIDR